MRKNQRRCEECGDWFDENDLDMAYGKWLCQSCEKRLSHSNFGGVFEDG